MKKKVMLNKIQDRLVDNIKIVDRTNFEFSEDEFISILSWIKCFNKYYDESGKEKTFLMQLPIISKRLWLDFAYHNIPSDEENDKGNFSIYINKLNNETLKSLILKLDGMG